MELLDPTKEKKKENQTEAEARKRINDLAEEESKIVRGPIVTGKQL